MSALRRLVQLTLAALLATAGGGLALVLLLAVAVSAAGVVSDGPGEVAGAAPLILVMLLLLGGIAVGPAVAVAGLPALAVGAALWAAGRRQAWARRRLAWAAAGAAVGLGAMLYSFPPWTPAGTLLDELPLPPGGPALSFMLAGAVGGRLFRSAMTTAAPFLGLDEEEEPEG